MLLAVAAAIFAVLFGAGSASAAIRPLDTGVTVVDLEPQGQLEGYQRIKRAGAGMTRLTVFWFSVAPAVEPASWDPTDPNDPNYDWSEVDRQIELASEAGLQVLMQIYGAPKWAERCENAYMGICDPNPTQFAQFSEAAAERYSGEFRSLPRVRYWQPWNEANLFLFFEPQYRNGKKVSPILYRDLLNRFAEVVKGVNPGNKVVAGGLAPLERPGGLGPLDFARRLLCMKGRDNPVPDRSCKEKARFDIWANNPYTTGGPTHESAGPDDVSLGDLQTMNELLRAARKAGNIRSTSNSVPLWVTEFSWDSAPPDPKGLPMKILVRWTSEAMYRAWKAGVSNFFWLSVRDWPDSTRLTYGSAIESGLYFRGRTLAEDRPKQNLLAFRNPFVALGTKRGVMIWGRTSTSTSGNVAIKYRKGRSWRRLTTVRADRNGMFNTVVKTRLARALAKKKRADIRATYRGESSRPFSLKPVKDFRQPPFGS